MGQDSDNAFHVIPLPVQVQAFLLGTMEEQRSIAMRCKACGACVPMRDTSVLKMANWILDREIAEAGDGEAKDRDRHADHMKQKIAIVTQCFSSEDGERLDMTEAAASPAAPAAVASPAAVVANGWT